MTLDEQHGGLVSPSRVTEPLTIVQLHSLFPVTQPALDWSTFQADGFTMPVTGIITREDTPAKNGMPLGGLDTGCIDLETTGLLGYMTIFNSLTPRNGPMNIPFLGLKVDGQAHVCATTAMPDVKAAKEVHYWGHYPVADVEFVMDGPVQVGLRAWSSFIPGDTADSMIPGAVFEVRLRSTASEAKSGTVAMSFPGFERYEVWYAIIHRKAVGGEGFSGAMAGMAGGYGPVMEQQALVSYTLAVIGDAPVQWGRDFGWNSAAWQAMDAIPAALAEEHDGSGLAVSTPFDLAPGEERVVRFVLAWHAPVWCANGTPAAGGATFTHRYAAPFADSLAVARTLVERHEDLLRRILAWQGEIYGDATLPGWLQDELINTLHLITETGMWAEAKAPLGDWCLLEDGLFSMNECPRSCPQMNCTPCDFYGNLPVAYFFPHAALSTLRAYKAYQFESGQIPFIFGGWNDVSQPNGGYQWALDGSCVVEMVDKLWQATGDDAIVREFYAMCRRITDFTMTRRPDYGIKQIVSMPEGNATQDWMEFAPLYGLVSHIGGVHLAHLRLMERMARVVGDTAYAQQCVDWREGGSQVLEDELWLGTHYRMYFEPETGKECDMVMVCQLDGEWIARFHGLPGVFQEDRAKMTMDTIARVNANPVTNPHGAVVFAAADGSRAKDEETGYWTGYGAHAPGSYMVAMTDIMLGNRARGLNLLKRTLYAQSVLMRGQWDRAILYRTDTGQRMFGNDYYQNMMLWSVPAVLAGQDLAGPCREGGLIARMLHAARRTNVSSTTG